MKKGVPISPDDIVEARKVAIPPEVFDAFNELIAENFNDNSATVKQKDVVARIKAKIPGADVYANHWLDVETLYEENGWSVYYDKPAYCETYDAFFRFTKK
jgi:hypothetical protein